MDISIFVWCVNIRCCPKFHIEVKFGPLELQTRMQLLGQREVYPYDASYNELKIELGFRLWGWEGGSHVIYCTEWRLVMSHL